MKYLSFIRHPEKYRDTPPPPALMEAMVEFIERSKKEGTLVDTGGLLPSKDGVRVRLAGGKLTVSDGPFTEAKEIIGGWAILKADSKEEAIRIATEFMELHRQHWPEFEGESEVRPMFEPGSMATTARTKLFPHLWYAKEAEEAARFYASIFPDSRVDRVTPLMSESPSGPPGSVKIVDFTLFGQRLQAISAGPHHEFNDAISMVVPCDDQAELDRYWNALLEGGGKPQACGWLIDRFGLRWQIVPAALDEMLRDPDPARTKRVSDAFLQMIKLDIATLEAAYRA